MKSSTWHKWKKWRCVAGAFLLMTQGSLQWYWGNLSTYVLSYAAKKLPATTELSVPWVPPLLVLSCCVATLISALLAHLLGKHVTIIIATLTLTAGWVGAHFAVQHYLVATTLVVGIVSAFGAFVGDGVAILYTVEWGENDLGTISAIALSGIAFGAIVYNQIITGFINPDNLKPDKTIGRMTYFSQDDVVDNIPSAFLVLAACGLVSNVVAFLLVRDNPNLKTDSDSLDSPDPTDYEATGTHSQCVDDSKTKPSEEEVTETSPMVGSKDVHPMHVIRTSIFYCYCVVFIMMEVPFVTLTTYYKSYGQLYIEDDHFLTDISTGLFAVMIISRVVCGMTLDRYGLKATFILHTSGSAIIALVFYASPILHVWCYAITTVVFGVFAGPIYIIFTYAVVKSFGKLYSIFNIALIMSPSLITALVLPPILDSLLANLGWFYIFGFSSCCSLCGLTIIVLTLPE